MAKYKADLADMETGTASKEWITPPRPEITPEVLQSTIIKLDDMAQADTSLKDAVEEINRVLVDRLDDAVGDKAYSKAVKKYRESREAIKELQKSGDAAVSAQGEMSLGSALSLMFEPRAGTEFIPRRILNDLYKNDPDLARGFVSAKIRDNVDNLGPDAKPSEVLEAIWGKDKRSSAHMNNMMDIVMDDKETFRMQNVKRLLEVGKEIEDISANDAIRSFVNGKFDPDVAHYVYVRLALSRAMMDRIDKNMGDMWFNLGYNPKFSSEWRNILESRKYFSKVKDLPSYKRQEITDIASSLPPEEALARLVFSVTGKQLRTPTKFEESRERGTTAPSL